MTDLERYFDLIALSGGVVELRAFLPSSRGEATWSGYFDNVDSFAANALAISERGAPGVFATINPPLDALRVRSLGRMARAARGGTTKDAEIGARHLLVVDLDPERPPGISATDAEKAEAWERARAIMDYLRSRGWPEPVVIDSGNGFHLYCPVDLPADDAGLVARCLQALDARFSDDAVKVDTSVGNASRIMKVPGTWARKGADTPQRPHRRSAFVSVPGWMEAAGERPAVSRRQLDALAALAPSKADPRGLDLDDETLRSALSAVASQGRPDRATWIRLSASTLAACGGDVARAEGLLVSTIGEETPGEYGPVLASSWDRIGPGTLIYMAKDAGWTWARGSRSKRRTRRHLRDTTARGPIGVCVADVEAEAVRWMWEGRLAAGKVHLLDGDPGTGKSTIYAYLAACMTAGVPWPDGSEVPLSARGGVVIVTAEDDVATTIRTRLEAAEADVSRVSVVGVIPTEKGPGRLPSLPDDVELLMEECARIGARLLVIDPVTAYLGDVNSHRDSDVRGALAPLAEAAERAGVAVLLVRHLNKGTGGSALYRGGGSIAFSGLARVVLLAGKVPDDATGKRRALAVAKNNLAPFAPTLGYHLESAGPFNVGRTAWHGPVPFTADDLVRPSSNERPTPALDEAAAFILDALASGPRLARELYAEAEEAGISEKTLKRAKARLRVEAERRGGPGGGGAWYWLPPAKGAKGSIPDPLSRHTGHGRDGIASDVPETPKEATGMTPLERVTPLNDRDPLGRGPLVFDTGQLVQTPHGVGCVTGPVREGRVSVEVDGLPVSYLLAEIAALNGISAPRAGA